MPESEIAPFSFFSFHRLLNTGVADKDPIAEPYLPSCKHSLQWTQYLSRQCFGTTALIISRMNHKMPFQTPQAKNREMMSAENWNWYPLKSGPLRTGVVLL